jgi:hypothetical protein
MSLFHVKTDPIADFTGTVTVYDQLGSTQTVAATDLVRPSDWNSQHLMQFNLSSNTAGSSQISGEDIIFVGGNNVTLSADTAGSKLVFSAANQSVQTQNTVSVLGSTGNISFANSNGITFGGNASTITASHNGLTSQSNQALSGPNGSFTFQTAQFHNSHGISWSTTTGSGIIASHNGLTTARASNDGIGLNTAQTNVTWTVNSAGLSLNADGYAGTATAVTGGASMTLNSNGLSFNGTALAGTGTTFNGANISGSMTMNSNGLHLSLSGAGGGTTNQTGPNIAAGTQTATSGTVVFSNSNNITFGMSDSSVVTASFNPINIGISTMGNTAGTSGTIDGAAAQYLFVGTQDIVVSQSVNGQSGTLSFARITRSGFSPYEDIPMVAGQLGQGTIQIEPQEFPNVQFDRVVFQIINTNSSNSSGSHTLSFWVGLYTRNFSTLSLWGSTSSSTALTHSGTVGSYSLYSGIRHFTIPWTTTVPASTYWIAMLSRTTSGGSNGSYSNLLMSNVASNFLGFFGSSHNTTYQMTLGQGVYSATASSLPNSIGFTQIRGSDSVALRAPNIMFASSTI